MLQQPEFLPMSGAEMKLLGWDYLDILLVSGDAYVDHPSFGTALLGRWLVHLGYRVGIVAQVAWQDRSFALNQLRSMGRPRLFVGANAGAIDSMLAHYTAFRKKRSDDAYSPGGLAGARPNRACIVYSSLIREAFPQVPLLLGGIEASLRRMAHYDFWTDSIRRSILCDSKADMVLYGMGELSLAAVAKTAKNLLDQKGACTATDLRAACSHIPGIALLLGQDHPLAQELSALPQKEWYKGKKVESQSWADKAFLASDFDPIASFHCDSSLGSELTIGPNSARDADSAVSFYIAPSYDELVQNPSSLIDATQLAEAAYHRSLFLAQENSGRWLIVNQAQKALDTKTMDTLYSLPFRRLAHPSYKEAIPALEVIRSSINTHRGCAGACSFCSIALHQGRKISSRSRESILAEARQISTPVDLLGQKGPHVQGSKGQGSKGQGSKGQGSKGQGSKLPRWASSISDVGGPSANMWQASCRFEGECKRTSCMHPTICSFFHLDQREGVSLLRDIAALPSIRNVRVASGVRFDLALRDEEALAAYCVEFSGGQLKVAPEHSAPHVLSSMRKPDMKYFVQFLEKFQSLSTQHKKESYTIPYLMSAFPSCTQEDMEDLGDWLKKRHWRPQQVQCFIPTPGTMATAMYYAQQDEKKRAIYVAKSDKERMQQHYALFPEQHVEKPEARKKKSFGEGEQKKIQQSFGAQGAEKYNSESSSSSKSSGSRNNEERKAGNRNNERRTAGGKNNERRTAGGKNNERRTAGGRNNEGRKAGPKDFDAKKHKGRVSGDRHSESRNTDAKYSETRRSKGKK